MVSEEMVKAAQGYFIKRSLGIDCGVIPTYDATKCALEAALRAAVPEGEPVAVKPLEWQRSSKWGPGEFVTEWWADSVAGTYRVWCDPTVDPNCWHVEYPGRPFEGGEHPGIEAAKAAAQADFDQRIRSALVSAPRPDMERELAEARAEIERLANITSRFPELMDRVRAAKGEGIDSRIGALREALSELPPHFLNYQWEADAKPAFGEKLVRNVAGNNGHGMGRQWIATTPHHIPGLAKFIAAANPDTVGLLLAQFSEAEAERDALAAAIQEAREVVSAIAGENQPAREWAIRVRDKIDAALSGESTPAPADKAEERREALEEAEAVAENELQEIADGAWGDNPARRGAARALISTPARREGE